MHFPKLVKGFSAGMVTWRWNDSVQLFVYSFCNIFSLYNYLFTEFNCNSISDVGQGTAWPVPQLLQGQGQVQRQQVRQHDHSGTQEIISSFYLFVSK